MQSFGSLCVIVGLGAMGWGFFMDGSVPSSGDLFERVNNIGLMNMKDALVTAGGALFVGGCAVFTGGKIVDAIDASRRPGAAKSPGLGEGQF